MRAGPKPDPRGQPIDFSRLGRDRGRRCCAFIESYLVVPKDAQNGAPDGVALIDTTGKTLLDALSYEGPITSTTIDGQTYSLVEGAPLPAAVADSNTVDASLIRNPDGHDSNDAATDWAFTTTPTQGAANVLTAPTP